GPATRGAGALRRTLRPGRSRTRSRRQRSDSTVPFLIALSTAAPRFAVAAGSFALRLLAHGRLQLLDVLGRQLRAVPARQLVELGGEREWWLIVRVIHTGQRADALVPPQDHRQRAVIFFVPGRRSEAQRHRRDQVHDPTGL